MSKIIDLTNDNMPFIIQSNKKKRAPPKCSYCGIQGHTVRSCNEPESMNVVREFTQMVNRFPQYETILNWLQTHDFKVLRFLVAKYTQSSYKHHYSKQMCFDILCLHISEKYNAETQRKILTVQNMFDRGNMLLWSWMVTTENIPMLYRRYCEQLAESESNSMLTEDECQMIATIISNRQIPSTISLYLINRLHRFLIYKHEEYIVRQNRAENSGLTIDYYVVRKNVAESIEIECPICMETKKTPNIIALECEHQFCKDCVMRTVTISTYKRCDCPLCRAPVHKLIQGRVKTTVKNIN